MIFVDTSAWFAAYVPSDPQHRAVAHFLRSDPRPIVTSDYVVDETITLRIARRQRQRAVAFGKDVLVDGIARLEIVTLTDVVQAFQTFTRYQDKTWSFTDCTSLVLMQRLRITDALTLDEHFRQMPGIVIVGDES